MTWVIGHNAVFVNLDQATGLNVDQVGADWVLRLGTTSGAGAVLPGAYLSEAEAFAAAQRLVNASEIDTLTA